DGKNDIVSTSAHGYGMWWHQQNRNKDGVLEFIRRDLFAPPAAKVEMPKGLTPTKEEDAIFTSVNKLRAEFRLPPLSPDAALWAPKDVLKGDFTDPPLVWTRNDVPGLSEVQGLSGLYDSPEALLKALREGTKYHRLLLRDGGVIG